MVWEVEVAQKEVNDDHGSRKNRQYVDRHELLNLDTDIKDLILVNEKGLFEWKNPDMNKPFMDYFISRKDDEDEDEVIFITTTT